VLSRQFSDILPAGKFLTKMQTECSKAKYMFIPETAVLLKLMISTNMVKSLSPYADIPTKRIIGT